jgi:hypothetical protein
VHVNERRFRVVLFGFLAWFNAAGTDTTATRGDSCGGGGGGGGGGDGGGGGGGVVVASPPSVYSSQLVDYVLHSVMKGCQAEVDCTHVLRVRVVPMHPHAPVDNKKEKRE